VMENHDWSSIKGSASAPYINGTLLAIGAHAENYQNVPNLHPSLPNYIWLESGNNQGVADDGGPQSHLLNVPHLTGLMNAAGVTWKSYQEDISGNDCPLNPVNKYFPKHNPAVYFNDINGGLNSQSAVCKAHVRPFSELQTDLDANTVPSYSFITPNICNDMHDNSGCQSTNSIANGDGWLKTVIPNIMASQAYKDGGLILVTWDESEGGNVPIGMIALSPLAKAGYTSNVAYTHSSTLRSIETIFGLTPMLGGAANANDLSDMFHSFP
jgi:phosphatidylinositol-3-phosphatase